MVVRDTAPDRAFELDLPPGWTPEPDEEGGTELARAEGAGLLHLVSFPQPAGEAADPAEELFAFLDEQGVEIEEEDVDDVELAGDAAMSLCEYVAEDEDAHDEEAATYWLVAVATAPGNLVFCSYSCPAGEEDEEREDVLSMLRSLRPLENPEP